MRCRSILCCRVHNSPNFELLSERKLADLGITAYHYRHKPSASQHIHFSTADEHKGFAVGFKTPPFSPVENSYSDNGLPHVLEHTTLCGSRKYPVRDPFMLMSGRSLSSYMNAHTLAEHTAYPFSTVNQQDYFNLLSVYLDAVLFPLLDSRDFAQEGQRREFSEATESDSPLQVKGVVYNEMKGMVSDSGYVFVGEVFKIMFPTDSPYHYQSGGVPAAIANLSHQDLLKFHSMFYSPENCMTTSFGNVELDRLLVELDSTLCRCVAERGTTALNPVHDHKAKPLGHDVYTKCQHLRDNGAIKVVSGPTDPMAPLNQQHKVCISWVIPRQKYELTGTDICGLWVLSDLLIGGPNSPFSQALLESGLGDDFTPLVGLDVSTVDPTFTIGVVGVSSEDIQQVVDVIQTTLEKTVTETDYIKPEKVLHQIELSKMHKSSEYPIQMVTDTVACWTHQVADILEYMDVGSNITTLRTVIADNEVNYFTSLIQKFLIENDFKQAIHMKPDKDWSKGSYFVPNDEDLDTSGLNEAEKKKIVDHAQYLKIHQSQNMDEEKIKVLPTLKSTDISTEPIQHNISMHSLDRGIQYQHIQYPTNTLDYINIHISFDHVPDQLRYLLPLWCDTLFNLGAGKYNHYTLSDAIDECSGGITVSPYVSSSIHDYNQIMRGITIKSSCFHRNLPKLLDIISTVFNKCHYDETSTVPLYTEVNTVSSQLLSNLFDEGVSYATLLVANSLGWQISKEKEVLEGLSQVKLFRRLSECLTANDGDNPFAMQILQSLKWLSAYMLNSANLKICLTSSNSPVVGTLNQFISHLPTESTVLLDTDTIQQHPTSQLIDECKQESNLQLRADQKDEGTNHFFLKVPSSIYHSSTILPTRLHLLHPDDALLQIAAQIINRHVLHPKLREQGGAYDSSMGVYENCMLSFTTYRDPTPVDSIQFIQQLQYHMDRMTLFTDAQVEEGKLRCFSSIDAPRSPQHIGMYKFIANITEHERKTLRHRLLAANKDQVRDAMQRQLANVPEMCHGVIGPDLPKAKQGWETIILH